jgi:hypothetical protein
MLYPGDEWRKLPVQGELETKGGESLNVIYFASGGFIFG